jgi:deazaflavin-dependent oxidoreductase (nitroreductase family)
MGVQSTTTDIGMKAMNAVHRIVLAVSGGRVGRKLGRMDVVELHTKGRSSGKVRSTMLTAPILDSERVVLVASKGGNDAHPQWYRNLCAEPDVEITVNDTRHSFRARIATAAEKSELWPTITAAYPGYARYQSKTRRDIPVVICEPR